MSTRVTVALCIAFVVSCAFGQNNNGRISGTITDNSGAAIAGAAVTVVNSATGAAIKAVTDSQGFYSVPQLPVGTFNVTVEIPGFRKAERTGLDLVDAGRISADFKME